MNKVNCAGCIHKSVCRYSGNDAINQNKHYEACIINYPFILTLECELFKPEVATPKSDWVATWAFAKAHENSSVRCTSNKSSGGDVNISEVANE